MAAAKSIVSSSPSSDDEPVRVHHPLDLSYLVGERRKNKQKKKKVDKTVRFGDKNLVLDELDSFNDPDKATWREVFEACCVHSLKEWLWIFLGMVLLAGSVYFLIFGLTLLSTSAQVMAGCIAGEVFGSSTNPLTSLMLAVLVTVLLQSSSSVTAIIVALVEGGSITVGNGVYMVMGANIGTTVTAVIVSFGHMRSIQELDRAFAVAASHSMFNFMTAAILFPLEVATGFLLILTDELATGAETGGREHWEGPIKRFVSPLSSLVILSNKKLMIEVAKGSASCADFYPIECDAGLAPSYSTCHVGLIGCDKETDRCPAFFDENATVSKDKGSGAACFFIALIILFVAMLVMVWTIQKLLFGMSTKVVHTITSCNGYLGIIFGCGLTLITQSSSVTTSMFVPFGGVGAMHLEHIYPVIIGANIGTAVQTMITALGSFGEAPLQVALSHLFFNLIGTIIFYPLPPLRNIPIWAAKRLGRGAAIWRFFPIMFTIVMYFLMPLLFIGLSALFHSGRPGDVAGGSVIVVVVASGLAGLLYWCKFRGGDAKYANFCLQLSLKRTKRRGSVVGVGETDDLEVGSVPSDKELASVREAREQEEEEEEVLA